MPFLGHSSHYSKDSKESGGKKWIKTPTGWKPIEQTGEVSHTDTEVEGTEEVNRNDTEEMRKTLESSFVKCIKRKQGTSRESSSYISIGQAMQQMHLVIACEDYRYQSFALQVVMLLFHETVYPCLSGSAQIYIITTLDTVINSVIKRDESCTEVLLCVNAIISSLEHVANDPVGSHSKKRAQIHLKKIERGKAAMLEHLEEVYAVRSSPHIFTLPRDCLRQVLICIKSPVDIVHFGMTCRETWSIVCTTRLWTDTIRTYCPPQKYSQIMDCIKYDPSYQAIRPKLQLTTEEAIEIYRQWYRENHVKYTRIHQPLLLCSLCEFLHWKGSSHPCIVKPNRTRFQMNNADPSPVSPLEFINMFM